jgi:integrase/recombinase XerD
MPPESPSPVAHITTSTTLFPAINAWSIYLNDQANSPHTVKAFIADLILLAGYLPPDRTIGSLSTNDLNNFLHWMQTARGVPCSPKTLSRRITSLKAFFRWLHKYGVILIDPAEKVIQKSVISLPAFTYEVGRPAPLHHRIAKKPDACPYALVALLLHTGIKKNNAWLSALTTLISSSSNCSICYASLSTLQRKIALLKADRRYQEYKLQYNPTERLFPWSPRRLEYILEDLGEEADLTKHLSFDMCRWTCALSDWQSGAVRTKIRQKLGVSKINGVAFDETKNAQADQRCELA